MARPKRERPDRAQLAVRVDPELRDRLQAEADRRDVSVSYLVSRALERQLPAWENDSNP